METIQINTYVDERPLVKVTKASQNQNYKSSIEFGNIEISNTKCFNWLQKIMWRLLLGIKITNLKESEDKQ